MVVTALVAGLTPVGVLEQMVNVGTLSAFVVSIGVGPGHTKGPEPAITLVRGPEKLPRLDSNQ